MRAATLFSGIGAPECACPDWQWLWHAEIEPFPAAVMQARHPGSLNLGDVLAHDFAERAERAGRPDVLVFGSPCQSFSVAGKRLGLSDPRGNLALVALEVARRLRPSWIVFENVPGLLSSWSSAEECPDAAVGDEWETEENSDFAAFLGAVRECGYSGCWRVLDARYWNLAQRRERVFFVGSLGDWRGPAAVLSLAEGLRGYPEKGRAERERVAPTLSVGANGSSGHQYRQKGNEDALIVAGTLQANSGRLQADAAAANHYVAHALRAEGFDASEDGTGRGTPLVPVAFDTYNQSISDVFPALRNPNGTFGDALPAVAYGGNNTAGPIDVATALNAHGGPHGRCDFESETFVASYRTSGNCGAWDTGDRVDALTTFTDPNSHVVAMNLRGREGGAMPEMADVASLRAASGGSSRSYVAQTLQTSAAHGITERTLMESADANAVEADAGKVLSVLLGQIGAEAFSEWGIGVLASFREAEILLGALLREIPDEGEIGGKLGLGAHDGSEPDAAGAMREMWEAGRARRSPPQSRPSGQSARELGAYLSELPQQGAPPAGLLRDLRRAGEGARLLQQALDTLEEAWRPTGVQGASAKSVRSLRSTSQRQGPVRQALHAGEAPALCQVRRLSVIECARLQGFPDLYTHIITKRWRKIDAEEARYLASHGLPVEQREAHRAGRWYTPVPADGPMYRAYGNSMAVPCLRWLLTRIEAAEQARSLPA